MTLTSILCDVLDNQRNLTKWYLKKIPEVDLKERITINGISLNSPLWNIGHLIWTDYHIGLFPLGYKDLAPEWVKQLGLGSSGEFPENIPTIPEIVELMNEVHQKKLDFFRSLDDSILQAPYSLSSLGFKSNYYALLHLARHEGIHAGGLAAFCKFKGIKTI